MIAIPTSKHAGIIRNLAKRLAVAYRFNPECKYMKSRYIVVGGDAKLNYSIDKHTRITECVIDDIEIVEAVNVEERLLLTFAVHHSINGSKFVAVLHYNGKTHIQASTVPARLYELAKPTNTKSALSAGDSEYNLYGCTEVTEQDDGAYQLMTAQLVLSFHDQITQREYHAHDDVLGDGPRFACVSALENGLDRLLPKYLPDMIDDGIRWSTGRKGKKQFDNAVATASDMCKRVFSTTEVNRLDLLNVTQLAVEHVRDNHNGLSSMELHEALVLYWGSRI
jgi:hypothetical protein